MTGRVLPIGGLKEKTLAARRSGVTPLLFPEGNKKDWDELAGMLVLLSLSRSRTYKFTCRHTHVATHDVCSISEMVAIEWELRVW